ncbi:MAG TPA: ADOP family duplicated permease, partial [Bryobacteraceae bacterium]|nr:ADOP family duplicated permease [Bryobacteraceae bacterium]
PSQTRWNTRGFRWLKVIGRLKPGVSLEQASLENQVLRRQIEAADPRRRPVPAWDKEHKIRERGLVLPGSGGSSYLRQRATKPLFILMVIVGMVLLIACANVAGLLLARAAGRRREIAIRLAVGAGRGRLVMQLLVESVVLALLGGVAGLGLAWFGSGALLRLLPNAGPFRMTLDVSPDSRLLLYTVAISLLSGVIFGIAPAVKATRPSSASWLKGEPPETTFVRGFRLDWCRMLVAAQVALSIVLLIGAGLFLRSLQNLRDLDPGFQRDSVLLVRTDPFQSGYSPQRARAYYERLLEDARLLPGVRAASLASITPLGGTSWNSNVSAEGYKRQPEERPFVEFNAVGPRYFETLGIPVLLGRDFRADDSPAVTENTTTSRRPGREIDTPGPRVAIVNEAFARNYFAGQNAVGKRLSVGDRFDAAGSYEVVGVVRDVRYVGLRDAAVPMIYFPLWRHSPYPLALCLRGAGDPKLLIGAIRRQAAAIDAAIPLLQARSMQEFLDDSVLQERLVATLCTLFGALAVLLAAVGLYGVMSQAVSRRTREIGVRIAMGAPRSGVMRMVIRDALVLVAAGAAIGIPAALALSRYVASLLYGISPQDPAAVAVSIGLLAVVTVAAAWVPARRATRIDPIRALRYE